MNETNASNGSSDNRIIRDPEAFNRWISENVAILVDQIGNIAGALHEQNGVLRQILVELAKRDSKD